MEDFNALAMSLGHGIADVHGCLILSRDGLVLGAYPPDSERATTRAWIRFATIGDPERGFVQFGTETWCYVRRAPYAGFALAGPAQRAGLVIDHMEQVLQGAEESRSRREDPRGTEAATVALRSEPTSRLDLEHSPSDPLMIDARPPVVERPSSGDSLEPPPPPLAGREPETIDEPVRDDAETHERPADPLAQLAGDANEPDADQPREPAPPDPIPEPLRWPRRDPPPDADPQFEPVDEADQGPEARPETGPEAGFEPVDEAEEEDDDVDRFSLAREFGRLLQRGEDPADG